MKTTTEVWIESRPTLGSLLRDIADARGMGWALFEVRVHPVGLAVLQRQMGRYQTYPSASVGYTIAGVGVVVDSTLRTRHARILSHHQTVLSSEAKP